MRRKRVVILHEGQAIQDLDLWPGDRVLYGADFATLGHVNSQGTFVPFLEAMH